MSQTSLASRLLPIGRPAARTHLLERMLTMGRALLAADRSGTPAQTGAGPSMARALAEASESERLLWMPAPNLHALTLDPPTVASALALATAVEEPPERIAILWDTEAPDGLWLADVTYRANDDSLTTTVARSDGVSGSIGVLPVMAVHRPTEQGVGLAHVPGPQGPPPEGETLKQHLAVLVRPLLYARLHLSGSIRFAGDGRVTYEPTPGTGGSIGNA